MLFFLGIATHVFAQDTWYSFQSGEWGDFNNWTQDGATSPAFVNPGNDTPGAGDIVIIRNAHAITMENGSSAILNNVSIGDLTIRSGSSLDLLTSTGHDFTDIAGQGTIRLSGVYNDNGNGAGADDIYEENLPDGDYVDFADALLGGTIEINTATNDRPFLFNNNLTGVTAAASGAISKALRINMGDSNDRAILQRDVTLSGNLTVAQGNLQIHSDNSETFEGGTFGSVTNTDLTLEVPGNVTINANGQITTGDANQRHQFNVEGNFTNNGTGTTSFTNEGSQVSGSESTLGIVDVNFLDQISDQTLTLNGPTNFYRIEIDKGSQAISLSISASSASNFNLFGLAEDNVDSNLSTGGSNNNAFALITGEVIVGSNIAINPLNTVGNYAIGGNARLVVDGGSVAKLSGGGSIERAIVLYGALQLDAGNIDALTQDGITLREDGRLEINGGELNANQIRNDDGVNDAGTFILAGGSIILNGGTGLGSGSLTGETATNISDYVLNLDNSETVYRTSNGSITIEQANAAGGILINSSQDNVEVSGGTINAETADDTEFFINSTAAFFNLVVDNTNPSSTTNSRVGVTVNDLNILNDLTITTGTTRSASGATYGSYLDLCPNDTDCVNLEVGRNLTIEDNAVLDFFNSVADNAGSARLTFNGTLDGTFYVGDISSLNSSLTNYDDPDGDASYVDYRLPVFDLVVDKNGGTLQLSAKSPGVEDGAGILTAGGGKNLDSNNARLLYVRDGLSVESGSTLSQIDPTGDEFGYIVRVYADTVDVDGNLLVYTQGVNPVNAFLEVREIDPDNNPGTDVGDVIFINSTTGSTIGNLVVDLGNDELQLGNDLSVTRFAYRHGGVNLGIHNLRVDILDFNTESNGDNERLRGGNGEYLFGDNTSGAEQYFFTDGNESDGGLSVKVPRVSNVHARDAGGLDDEQNVGFDPSYDETNNEYQNNNLLWFPIGIKDKYTPAVMYIISDGTNVYNDDEYVTVRPVNSELQTTDQNVASNDGVLEYYWSVDFEGFTSGGEPTVAWLFQYDEGDAGVIGTEGEASYVPGKVLKDGNFTRSDDGDADAVKDAGNSGNAGGNEAGNIMGTDPGNIIIFNGITADADANDDIDAGTGDNVFIDGGTPDLNTDPVDNNWNDAFPGTGFTLESANYTAGVEARFVGQPRKLYARQHGVWHDNNSWSTDIDGNPALSSGDFPQTGDIVIIGADDPSNANDVNWAIGVDPSHPNYGPIDIAQLVILRYHGGESSLVTFGDDEADRILHDLGQVTNLDPDASNPSSTSTQGSKLIFAGPGLPGGDFAQFVEAPNTIWTYTREYPATNANLNGDTPRSFTGYTISSNLGEYPNLQFEDTGNGSTSSERVIFPDRDLTINGDIRFFKGASFIQLGDNNTSPRTITVGGDIEYRTNSSVAFEYPASGEPITFVVEGNIDVDSRNDVSFLTENSARTAGDHIFELHGDFIDVETGSGNATDIDFYNPSNTGHTNVDFRLSGTQNSVIPAFRNANFFSVKTLIIDKGSDLTYNADIQTDITVPNTSVFNESPIEIVNGLLILNNNNIDVVLADASTGNFLLPNLDNADASSGSGGLEVRQGIVRIEGANTGLELDGPLTLSGGDADFADGTNNNFIRYSSSGQASITINDAASELRVGTQIRRSTLTDAGILDLELTAGSIVIGEGTGGENTRGVLEILNAGSSFTHTGGTITLLSDNNYGSTPTIASLFLEPATSNLTGSSISIDLTNNDQDFTINSTIALNDLTLSSTSGSGSEIVALEARPLTVNGDLSVQNDISLQSNDLDLTLLGSVTFTGTAAYSAGSNTTSFNVAPSVTNTLSGAVAPSFNNFEKIGTGTLQLNSDISITGSTFDLSAGTLDDNSNTITFTGQQLTNNATHSSPSNSSTTGILFNGSSQQQLSTSGTGTFGNLIIDNTNGVAVPDVSQDYQVNNRLTLDEGVFDIGPALLVIGTSGEIQGDAASEGSYGSAFADFSESNQIQTNSSIIDFGVEKEFSASTTTNFTFPVGEATRYTPVEISFSTAASGTSGSTAGTVRIRPRNAVAPIMNSESQAVQDAILQYYWLVNSTDLTGFEADLIFNYDDEVVGTDPESSYQGALAFFSNPDDEVSDGIGTVNTTANTISIPLNMPISSPADSLTDDNDFSGEYFAGDPATIPDVFQALLYDNNTGNGNVNDPANYCFDGNDDGDCNDPGDSRATDYSTQVVGGVVEVIAGNTLSLNVSNVNLSRTTIPATSVVEIQSGTSGHNLGQVSGTGAIRVLSNTTDAALPAGDYAGFFTNCTIGGGALEYGGSGNYTILNETNEVKSLTLNGGGTKTFVANSINICEDFTITAGSATFADNNTVTVNRDFFLTDGTVNLGQDGIVNIAGDVTLTAGTINGAIGTELQVEGNISRSSTTISLDDAEVVMQGSAAQQITGAFTGANDLGSLTIENPAGVTANDDIEVSGTMRFTDGILSTSVPTLADPISTAGVQLILSSSSSVVGASDTSYVDGLVTRNSLATTGSIVFPTGDNGFLAEVTVSNPSTVTNWTAYYINGNPQNISNNINFGPPETISDDEYWVVDGSGNATIAITYGEQSDVVDATGLAIARLEDDNIDGNFDNNDQWVLVDVNNSSTDPNLGTLTTTSQQTFSSTVFTTGEQQDGTLPVELIEFLIEDTDEGALITWRTETERENFGFTLERTQPLTEEVIDTTWSEVAFIEGAGTTQDLQTYNYLDDGIEKAGEYAYRLIQIDFDGVTSRFGPRGVTIRPPENFELDQNYPNPFNPSTNITYSLPEQSRVRLEVYNIIGRRVATLVDRVQPAGRFTERFDGSRVSSGMYIMVLRVDGRMFTRKMMLIK